MPKRMWLALALICGGETDAITVRDIPALPLKAAPADDPVYPSGYRRSQLEAARKELERLPDLLFIGLDETQGRVQLGLRFEAQRAEAERRLRALRLPPNIAVFETAPDRTLPTGTPLLHPHRAGLSGPLTIKAGTTGTWTLLLTNTGQEALPLQFGACDLSFEVWRAETGATVRPVPGLVLCTDQLLTIRLAPGETRDVLNFRWDGSGPDGQPLPPGVYLLRAAFDNRVVVIRPPDLPVNVTR